MALDQFFLKKNVGKFVTHSKRLGFLKVQVEVYDLAADFFLTYV